MGLLKPGIKSRLEGVTEFIKTSYHVAFIPFVIYMGTSYLYTLNTMVVRQSPAENKHVECAKYVRREYKV